MTERKERIKQLRKQLLELTAEKRQVLAAQGMIATIEGRVLSLHNTLLVYLQSNGQTPTVVGGYKQWKAAGRQVQRGQHGFTIFFPVGPKDEDGDIIAAERFFTGTVFDISQTEAIETLTS